MWTKKASLVRVDHLWGRHGPSILQVFEVSQQSAQEYVARETQAITATLLFDRSMSALPLVEASKSQKRRLVHPFVKKVTWVQTVVRHVLPC